MENVILGLIKNLKTKDKIQVWYAHCKNARKSVNFERACEKERVEIKFKYTSPGKPY